MDLERLIAALSRPEAYPHPAAVEVRQTHISVVFLAGARAYKVKKPVALGFLDFTTLARRRHFCDEEVRLNRRLAPSVYRGVVPVTRAGDGLRIGGEGEAVEWAVEMERLPDAAQLEQHVIRGTADAGLLAELGRRLASFHAGADAGPRVAAGGRFDVVAGNARDNLTQSASHVGITLHRAVHGRLRDLTEQALERLRPLIESRAARGVPRDTHGDLRLEHVYLFPERRPPDDLVIVDCIEFNERFRFADPVSDTAFLFMDLLFHGRPDLAAAFGDAYFCQSGDDEGRALLAFYTAYRAAVRGKVDGMTAAEAEVPAAQRAAARQRGRAHWLLALAQLQEPGRRPCLVFVGGLPGAGKSTLARGLAEHAGFRIIRSDIVRKELTGVGDGPARAGFAAGIYTPAWNDRTYAECLRRAEDLLFEGERVVVDAGFREDARRGAFLAAGRRWGVPALGFLCQAEPATVRARLAQRHGDVSDADWSIYLQTAARWEEPGPATRPFLHFLSTEGEPREALGQTLAILHEAGLVDLGGEVGVPASAG
jgi:aminoglycoside phosphotransferase family enzyme/predicted kinase